MTPLLEKDERALVVARLREIKAREGQLSRAAVTRAADVCTVSNATIYRWLTDGVADRRERSRYELTERDKVA